MTTIYSLNIVYIGNFPDLSWQPHPDTTKYIIYRGRVVEEFEKIAETQLTQYYDESEEANIDLISDNQKWVYQIASVDKFGKETKFSEIQSFKQEMEYPYFGVFKEMRRRSEELVIGRMMGETVEIYLKRGAGNRCSNGCWNEIRKDIDSEKPLCLSCYNTGYEGGFIKTTGKVILKNSDDAIQTGEYGYKWVAQKVGEMSTYPLLSSGDWIRTQEGQIWVADRVTHKNKMGFLTVQTIQFKGLMTGHFYYNIRL